MQPIWVDKKNEGLFTGREFTSDYVLMLLR